MRKRLYVALSAAAFAGVVINWSPGDTAQAQTGGCQAAGQFVATTAQSNIPAGEIARESVPIRDEAELYKTLFCNP
jgi:hypothetical protein